MMGRARRARKPARPRRGRLNGASPVCYKRSGRIMRTQAMIRTVLVAVACPAALGAAGCRSNEVVRFHVIYSTDAKSYVEPCT